MPQAGVRENVASTTEGDASDSSTAPSSMAVILIDRSLDMATPCLHADHPLDAMLALLPRQQPAPPPHHSKPGTRAALRPADVRVHIPDLAPLQPLQVNACAKNQKFGNIPGMPSKTSQSCSEGSRRSSQADDSASQTSGRGEDDSTIPNLPLPGMSQSTVFSSSTSQPSAAASSTEQSGEGAVAAPLRPLGVSIWHPADNRFLKWWEELLPKKGRDALVLIRKWLKECLRGERITPAVRSKLSSTVAAAELQGLTASLSKQPGKKLCLTS